jgi:hypothetical protein
MGNFKYQYVVVAKWFYYQNGVDVAGAIDERDIRLFSSLKKAKEYVEWEMSNCRTRNNVDFVHYTHNTEYKDAKTPNTWVYSQPTYDDTYKIRYAFVIQKQMVE